MRREEILLGGINCSSSSSSSSSIRCEDCGNQAKRDCEHMRCRTCCKSRGYHCQTHIKSTWIPVAGRKPRYHTMPQQQQQSPALNHAQQQLHDGPNPKRYRSLNNPAADALGLGERNLPGEVSFPAVFRCVRVSSVDNVVDQYAYQTSVSIGGHIFTGILYDQGPSNQPEGTGNYVSGENSSSLQHPNFANGTTFSIPGPLCAFNPSASSSQLFQYPKY